MNDDVLGRDPLEMERDSIWIKPKSAGKAPPMPAVERPASPAKDYSKVVLTEEKKSDAPPPERTKGMVKEGPPLVSPPPAPVRKSEELHADPPEEAAGKSDREEQEKSSGLQETLQLVGFKLGKEFFGIAIIDVQEIIRHQEITMVPRTPDFVEGVISLRGRVIPVINLRKRFSMKISERTKETRIVIVELDCGTVGFIVDAVTEVISIPKKSIEPAPPTATGISREYILGVGKLEDKLMVLLNLNQVLSIESKQKIKQMATGSGPSS